jgi:hypothetical protein
MEADRAVAVATLADVAVLSSGDAVTWVGSLRTRHAFQRVRARGRARMCDPGGAFVVPSAG